MAYLSTEQRNKLAKVVVQARDDAEAGARIALESLAVHHHEPYGHMTAEQRKLRNRLRVHGRQVGDKLSDTSGKQTIDHLVQECAYEHWHRMLFARFLAENHLLIEPNIGVAVSLQDCEELAKEQGIDQWTLASRFAQRMLPQVFRADHPVLEVTLAREHRNQLEKSLERLGAQVFTTKDALGWVYQFWQSKRKDEVNASEVKIGADELPAVTQLFTEPYMVEFLLHNSLGAWWVTRYPDEACPVDLTYLRRLADGAPAAGKFDAWPDTLADFKLLDPCCGSGHFLVVAFHLLVAMRMTTERLTARDAVDAVLRDNLHGLEIDRRCVEIAAFAIALEAWRYPNAGGYRPLPPLNLAWCGQPLSGNRERWTTLAEGDAKRVAGMSALYDTFHDAPLLGSLIDPSRATDVDLLTASFDELQPLFEKALRDHAGEAEWEETAIAAKGIAAAAQLLVQRYHLVVTNVPYLTRGKQNERLREFCERRYGHAKNDLANVFLERCLELCLDSPAGSGDGGEGAGVTQIVMPQNWLSLTSYTKQREHLLREAVWNLLGRLGMAAFEVMDWWAFNTILLTITNRRPSDEHALRGVDASAPRTTGGKAQVLRTGKVVSVSQKGQLGNPDARVALEDARQLAMLGELAQGLQGVSPADAPHYGRSFWEMGSIAGVWVYWQSSVTQVKHFGGKELVLWFGNDLKKAIDGGYAYLRGTDACGKLGVVVRQMRNLPCALHTGAMFDTNSAVVLPYNKSDLPAIWCFCSSPEYNEVVRRIDQKLNVTNATLVKVPFDLAHWQQAAAERYPHGLPKPYSDVPTQWIFHGHPCGSVIWDEHQKWTAVGPLRTDDTVLHVTVARLLGYRWPAEGDTEMELAAEARAWVDRSKALYHFADDDGIVCLPPLQGELPAHERLIRLLEAAYGDAWNAGVLNQLLDAVDCAGKSLDVWLRDKFFEQHCKLFHNRPFVWHLWDGLKDGFAALLNYHKLDRNNLEKLIYSYLGDWIRQQQAEVKAGVDGAHDRLAAANGLKQRLEAILRGEQPLDIFVRWKPLAQQPIGWNPDLNDGVRLNIRPFMLVDDVGKKGAGVLRTKPNIDWKKDRGKDVGSSPWFPVFKGERINDHHLSLAEKQAAREQVGGKQ